MRPGPGRIHAGTGKSTRKAVSLIQEVQDRSDGESADDRAQDEGDLLFPRRSTDDVTGLEVLQVIVGNRSDADDDAGNEDGQCRCKLRTLKGFKDTG